MRDYRQMTVACFFEVASEEDINDFIQGVIEGEAEYSPCIFDAYNKNLKVARVKMLDFLALTYPDFRIDSHEGAMASSVFLKEQCKHLISGQISPVAFCTFFNYFESFFSFSVETGQYDPPYWGDLWNCCDWCDDSWTPENSPHLIDEAKRVVYHIEEVNPLES